MKAAVAIVAAEGDGDGGNTRRGDIRYHVQRGLLVLYRQERTRHDPRSIDSRFLI
jgi:hypothetical protein